MTAVLVFGGIPNTGHVPKSGTERISVGNAEGAILPDAVIDLVRERQHAAGYVVALYPSWQPEPTQRALRLARSSLATDRLILTPSSLPPLALSLVADQLGYLAPYCPPGALIAIMSALERVTLSGAWVRSVTGLEHVPASLSHHVASYVPGSGFMVTVSPAGRIHRITGSAPIDELPYHPADPVHVLTAEGEGGDTDWLQSHLLPAIRAQHVRQVAPPPLAESYWGTKKYIEFVAFSGHPKALSVIANSVRCRPCRWCGELVGTATCPLCGMVTPYRPSSQPPPPAEGPAPTEAPTPSGDTSAPSRPDPSSNPSAPAPPAAPQRPPQSEGPKGGHRTGPPDRTGTEESRFGRSETGVGRLSPGAASPTLPTANPTPAHTSNGVL